MALKLTNTSHYVGKRGKTDWWEWTAFVEGTNSELDKIDYVEYHLHPSFQNPIRRRKRREDGFALKSKGWGVFQLQAKVVYKDTNRRKVLKHLLEFENAEIED